MSALTASPVATAIASYRNAAAALKSACEQEFPAGTMLRVAVNCRTQITAVVERCGWLPGEINIRNVQTGKARNICVLSHAVVKLTEQSHEPAGRLNG